MGLLHAARGGGGLASRLGGELLAGGLASRGFARRLLGTSHGSGANGRTTSGFPREELILQLNDKVANFSPESLTHVSPQNVNHIPGI